MTSSSASTATRPAARTRWTSTCCSTVSACSTADRAGRVSILDKGASVDVFVDTDGNLFNGFELTVATLKTADVVTVGQDILVGTL